MDSDGFIRPPGTYYDILAHPTNPNRAVEVAIVQDHRFAFYYWLKWRNVNFAEQPPPDLVSLDWHQDLTQPCDVECEWLRELNQADYREVALFTWDKLHPHNDGHIMAAAYLNLIGDVHVLQKQEEASSYAFSDRDGREHWIHSYSSLNALLGGLAEGTHASVFFDIDLDYFTESEDKCGGGESLQLVSLNEVLDMLHPSGKLVSWVYPRLAGMTIATEPEYCGGMVNSNAIFGCVVEALFSSPLLGKHAQWRKI